MRQTISYLTIISLVLTLSSTGFSAPVQWQGNGHWYEVVVIPAPGVAWHEAKAAAEEKGGYLATITSAAENEFVYNLTVSTPGAWEMSAEWAIGPYLGGYQDRSAPDYSEPSGGWRWVTGEPWEYTAWLQQPHPQPDNWLDLEDYLFYWGYPNQIMPTWNDGGDVPCTRYVIEYAGIYISSIEPSSGAPGILATIRGQGFNAPCLQGWVNFGPSEIWGTGKPSKNVSWTDTEIVVEVPTPDLPNPSGERVVEVTVQKRFPTQASNSVSFTYKMPHIDSISPASGEAKQEVVIRGHSFGIPGKQFAAGYHIRFGRSSANFWKSWTDTEIVVKAPMDYGTGQTDWRIVKWIVKVALLGWSPSVPQLIIDIIEDLASDVMVRPGEGEIEVNVIVTTPVGESNAELFTYTVK